MHITYDPEKNQRNIQERGLSFEEVADLDWETAVSTRDDRRNYGEERYRVFGRIGARLFTVVFTPRDEDEVRVISFRRANRREEVLYNRQREEQRGR